MATNEVLAGPDVRKGAVLPVANTVHAGDPVMVLGFKGVAQINADGGAATKISSSSRSGFASVALEGVWKLQVTVSTARAVGQKVYINTSTGALSDTATSSELFGLLYKPLAATGIGYVYLLGSS